MAYLLVWAESEQDIAIERAKATAELWGADRQQRRRYPNLDNQGSSEKDIKAAAVKDGCEWSRGPQRWGSTWQASVYKRWRTTNGNTNEDINVECL